MYYVYIYFFMIYGQVERYIVYENIFLYYRNTLQRQSRQKTVAKRLVYTYMQIVYFYVNVSIIERSLDKQTRYLQIFRLQIHNEIEFQIHSQCIKSCIVNILLKLAMYIIYTYLICYVYNYVCVMCIYNICVIYV